MHGLPWSLGEELYVFMINGNNELFTGSPLTYVLHALLTLQSLFVGVPVVSFLTWKHLIGKEEIMCVVSMCQIGDTKPCTNCTPYTHTTHIHSPHTTHTLISHYTRTLTSHHTSTHLSPHTHSPHTTHTHTLTSHHTHSSHTTHTLTSHHTHTHTHSPLTPNINDLKLP